MNDVDRGKLEKICNIIQAELESTRLLHFVEQDNDDEKSRLIDMLSSGDDISTGKEEIENIVENLFFVLENELKGYVSEDYLHLMLAKQKEAFEKSLLSDEGIEKIVLNILFISGTQPFKKLSGKLAKALSGKVKVEGVEEKNLKELYEKYKHLDNVFSDKELMKSGDFKYNMLYEFWQVTKALTKP